MNDILIVGGGIFGLTAAIELKRRGHGVTLVDPGPIPHPLAASTDISKVVRMEYGVDLLYMEMVERAIEGWRQWNVSFDEELYHESGVTMLTREAMAPGGFEYESYRSLLSRGHAPERLDAKEIERRFPAWSGAYVDGFYHAVGGFAESGRVSAALAAEAASLGVQLHLGSAVVELVKSNGRMAGVRTQAGEVIHAGHVVVAAGAWTPVLVPDLSPVMKVTGHPVFHLKPVQPDYFTPPLFATFTADVARTGWYGFPVHPRERVVKVATHGVGLRLHPDAPRVVTEEDERNLRRFLADALPALADAPIVYTRRCLYCDTLDEHFLIDHHPETTGLSVASGGSGHGFKFAPILGPLIADMVESNSNPWLEKFRWRSLETGTGGEEAARFHG
ncbi:MAG: FAD-dependent oxidoreductase [Rhodothermales bacterium]